MEDGNNRKHGNYFYYQTGVKAVTSFPYKNIGFQIFKYFHHLIFQWNINNCYEEEKKAVIHIHLNKTSTFECFIHTGKNKAQTYSSYSKPALAVLFRKHENIFRQYVIVIQVEI